MSYGSVAYGSAPYAAQGGGLSELNATGLVVSTVLSRPALTQNHVLDGNDLVVVPVLGEPDLAQYIEGDNIVVPVLLSEPQVLLLTDVLVQSVLSRPVLTQNHHLVGDGLLVQPYLREPILGDSLIFVSRGDEWLNGRISAAETGDPLVAVEGIWVSRDGGWRHVYFGD